MNLDKRKDFIINFLYIALWAALVFLIFKVASVYLLPFFIGVIIAYVVQKPSAFLYKKTKIKKEICAAFLSVIFFLLTIAILVLSLWAVYLQLSDLFGYINENYSIFKIDSETLVNKISRWFSIGSDSTIKNLLKDMVDNLLSKSGALLSNSVTTVVKRLPEFFISSVITIVATCYIAKDYERLKEFLRGFLGKNRYEKAIEIKGIVTECVFKIFVGYFWIFVITFFMLIVGFLLLGVKKYFIIAVLVAIFDLLPIIGTGTVLLPWAAILFLQNDYKKGIGVVVLYLVIAVVRNFAEPKIIGKQIEINPLFMLVFIFLGFKLGGALGMILLPVVFTVIFTYARQKI